jgi:uncharacterized 2Fe-2S/4Fe-4S cluster protein (DUF4445 family)
VPNEQPLPVDINIPAYGRHLSVAQGTLLSQALLSAGIPLRADCGGQGRCGKCVLKVRQAGIGRLADQWQTVLACQYRVDQPLDIKLPSASILDAVGSLNKAAAGVDTLPCLRVAPDGGLILALDLGTTTIAGYLCDQQAGSVLGTAAMRNPQGAFGEDVISRIRAATVDQRHLQQLQHLACQATQRLVGSLLEDADQPAKRLSEVVVVGNPTMLHLLLGVEPASLGHSPFTPAFVESRRCPAPSIGLDLPPHTMVRTLPLVSGFWGADVVAAAILHNLDQSAANGIMLIDIGTNGEICLNHTGSIYGTSCATGPALEGATITCGMLALAGAVDSWQINRVGNSSYTTIGSDTQQTSKPCGICGSGVISAIASLLRAGLVEPSGRIDGIKARSLFRRHQNGQAELVLVPAAETEHGRALVLTQTDIRAVQLAKGAIRTGVEMLCDVTGMAQPYKILVAGTLGNFLDIDDLLTIGMLPGMDPANICMVGNAAGGGAVCAAFDPTFLPRADALTRRIETIDLAADADFQTRFVKSLSFLSLR